MAEKVQRQEPHKMTFNKVKIKGRPDAVEHQRIGEVTVGVDANGQVTFVDFGGADVEVV